MCGECNWPIEKKEKKMQWIEVEKKLPPEGLRVVSINMKSKYPEYKIDYLVYLDDGAYIWANRSDKILDTVTHWMPLLSMPG